MHLLFQCVIFLSLSLVFFLLCMRYYFSYCYLRLFSEWPLTFISLNILHEHAKYMNDVRDKNVATFVRPCYVFCVCLHAYNRSSSISLSISFSFVHSFSRYMLANGFIFMYHSCTLPWLTSLPFLFNIFLCALTHCFFSSIFFFFFYSCHRCWHLPKLWFVTISAI